MFTFVSDKSINQLEPSRAVNPDKIIMASISRIERMINIINKAYKMGYKFDYDGLAKYQEEAVKILTNADIDANDSITKEALIANLLEINDNGLESELYVLEDVEIDAESYLCENAPIYDYSRVDMSWGYNQSFYWCDEFGYDIWQSGEIVSSNAYKHRFYMNDDGEWEEYCDNENGAIFIDKVCDSLGRVIQLYC